MALGPSEYALLVEQAPIMIWRADTTGACDYFNERWLAFTGRTLQQELGFGWADAVHPDDFDRCVAIYQRHFAARQIFEMEYRLRRHDGAWRWIFDRGVPFYSGREFGGFIGSCVDVTARVEAEQALEQARQEEIADLRGLLPICACCKQVRDDDGYWHRVEAYVQARSAATFTHTYCPPCLDRLYPEDGEATRTDV